MVCADGDVDVEGKVVAGYPTVTWLDGFAVLNRRTITKNIWNSTEIFYFEKTLNFELLDNLTASLNN